MRLLFTKLHQKAVQTLQNVQRRATMDPRSFERPQKDDNRPGTSQEDPHKAQEREKKKRKCQFSAEEQEILVREVTEHQHQLFVISNLPIGRREAIWQQIVDKINSVAEVRRTVIECKKHWHDCKLRTKEKMARNRKAALQTGGGIPAPQEALDHMEEMEAAVIPEEIVTGIQGQDSAVYQETTQMQGKSHGEQKWLFVNCKRGGPTYYTMHGNHDIQGVEWAKGHGKGAWAVQRKPGAQYYTTPTTLALGYAAMPRMM
ncbi:hypothetical protein NDU88_004631 [Pleurodeles waltl]|uniref:Nuclear apoptosis-inducing factor 1 n=1 Tax=Pleurodeles waltl TaxID=8319 RepID=A0AAV7NP19_PLEWA|nr:hypothetical protein NDU88_004631 [Pleurodeles waltl]